MTEDKIKVFGNFDPDTIKKKGIEKIVIKKVGTTNLGCIPPIQMTEPFKITLNTEESKNKISIEVKKDNGDNLWEDNFWVKLKSHTGHKHEYKTKMQNENKLLFIELMDDKPSDAKWRFLNPLRKWKLLRLFIDKLIDICENPTETNVTVGDDGAGG